MPIACPWKRPLFATLVGVAVALVGTPRRVCAEQLVLCFAGGALKNGGANLMPLGVNGQDSDFGRDPWLTLAAADGGAATGTRPHPRARVRSRHPRAKGNPAAAMAALILLVGDVPGMPQTDSSDPMSITGLTNTGGGSSSGGGGPGSPPDTPEPTALLSGLLGFGLTGAYAFCRRRPAGQRVRR
jgi:hypothetical protein